jgi:nitrogen fixation/metabolism regulation signal transduction histidine kinase
MRLNIALKLFLGFCAVILLNVFYVFVVNQLTDLNSIATILKIQEDVKNKLLKIDSFQSDRRRSRTSYEAIGKPESVQNFLKAGTEINVQVDSAHEELTMIAALNSTIFGTELYNGPYIENSKKMIAFVTDVEKYSKLYEDSFKDLRNQSVDSTERSKAKKTAKTPSPLSPVLDFADQKVAQSLKEINGLIDQQTKIVIKEIENRIDEVKRQTIIILSGIVIIAVGFALLFSRAITRSMRRLKESAGVIGKGNFDFDASGYPNDEIGDLAAAFFVMATDLKTAQDELVKSRRLAAIGEVVASVNHEINNPLMIISGNAQFLEMSMDRFPDEMKERVRIILEETERISKVTKKLREIKNPVVEDYTSSGEQMINLEKSTSV